MKFIKLFFSFLIVTAITVRMQAQSTRIEEIKKVENLEREAVLQLDTGMIKKYWSKNIVVNAPNNSVWDREMSLEGLRQGLIHYSSFERQTEKITVVGNVVVSMGLEVVKPTGKAPNAGKTVKRRFTNIWMKNNGSWELAARQATIISIE
jgi:hypothetical protein